MSLISNSLFYLFLFQNYFTVCMRLLRGKSEYHHVNFPTICALKIRRFQLFKTKKMPKNLLVQMMKYLRNSSPDCGFSMPSRRQTVVIVTNKGMKVKVLKR